MDNQKLNQFLNEQSLINLSMIEQLNQQAGYLNSIVEHLEYITDALEHYQMIHPVESASHYRQTNETSVEPHHRNALGIDTSRAKGMVLGERLEEQTKSEEKEQPKEIIEDKERLVKEQKEEVIEDKKREDTSIKEEVVVSVNEAMPIDKVKLHVKQSVRFGDRIQIITSTLNQTGIFLEFDEQHIIWVIDEGKLTFTDIHDATIVKLS